MSRFIYRNIENKILRNFYLVPMTFLKKVNIIIWKKRCPLNRFSHFYTFILYPHFYTPRPQVGVIYFFYELPMVKFNYYSCNSQNTIEKPVKWLKKKFQKSIFQNKISYSWHMVLATLKNVKSKKSPRVPPAFEIKSISVVLTVWLNSVYLLLE